MPYTNAQCKMTMEQHLESCEVESRWAWIFVPNQIIVLYNRNYKSIRYVPGKYNPYLPTRKDNLQLINWPREEPKLKTQKVKTNDIKISFLFSSYQGLPHITLMKQYEGMQHFQTGPLRSGSHRLRDAEKVVLKKFWEIPHFLSASVAPCLSSLYVTVLQTSVWKSRKGGLKPISINRKNTNRKN